MKKLISVMSGVLLCFSLFTMKVNASDDVENTNDEVSDVMSYAELVQYHALTHGLGYAEAANEINSNNKLLCTNSMRLTSDSYRVLRTYINVKNGAYKPRLEFYCNTSESGGYWGIKNIYSTQLNRYYKGVTKQFTGEVASWLRSAYQIEYLINGDFFENGKTTQTVTTSTGFGINAKVSVEYSASYSSDHYAYCYDHQTRSFQQ